MGDGTYVDIPDNKVGTEAPWSLVNGRFDATAAYANNSYDKTYEYMTDLQGLLDGLVVPDASGIGDIADPGVTPINYITRPGVTSLDLDTSIPEFDKIRQPFDTVPAVSEFNMPTIGFSEPQWAALLKPDISEIESPGDAPATIDVEVPAAPSITLPDSPNLADIVIPSAPESILPVFDAIRPSLEINLPEPFSYNEPSYQSDMWTEIMTKVLNDIREGGTGLEIDVENSIWARATERLRAEREKSIRQVEKKLGDSGFDMPHGAIASALLEIENNWTKSSEEQIDKISIEQAKLAQTNSHFIIEKGIQCEGILRQFFNDQNNRILEASKQVAMVGIEVFKASVNLHNAMVEQYKADATVFEARVRAAQQEIELFKSKVESARVSVEVQSLLVDIYQKQIQAVESQVKIYSATLEGVKTKVETNKIAIDAYGSRVAAYNASITGEKLKLDLYSAEIDGEKGKADVYRSQVEAYNTRVTAESKKTDAEIAVSRATIDTNNAKIEEYKADILAYEVEIGAITKKLGLTVDAFQAEVSAYNAETAMEGSYYSALEKEMQIKIENANHLLQKAVAEIKAVTDGYVAVKELEVKGNEGIMNVSAQMTASALSAVHASASWGYSSSDGRSESWSHGESLSESHSFDETPT